MNKEDECVICLDTIQNSDYVILSCKHYLHYDCLEKWLNKKKDYLNICPLCDVHGEVINIIEVPKKKIDTEIQMLRFSIEEQYEPMCCCNIL
jgi:hypothetical protein